MRIFGVPSVQSCGTLSGCVVSICCVGYASLDVVCDEFNDCAWNVCL